MDSLLAIVEIFANITHYGDKADYFKNILNECGILEKTVSLVKLLKDTTDIMIEHKIFEPEEKFATFTSKNRQKHPFGGFLSKLLKLLAAITYNNYQQAEPIFIKNQELLNVIISFTKADDDNPQMREWSLMTIRNLCQVSDKIRQRLEKMQQLDIDLEGKKTLERLGVREVFEKEKKKLLKRDENKK